MNFIKKLFQKEFVEWDEYKNRIDFIDNFYWQQSVRRDNLRNMGDRYGIV